MDFLTQNAQNIGSFDAAAGLPTETVRMAMVVLATLPIVMAYPFFQRYFVQGLTVGSVKANFIWLYPHRTLPEKSGFDVPGV